MAKKEKVSAVDVLFPGREIVIIEGKLSARVYPVGFKHVKALRGSVLRIIDSMMSMPSFREAAIKQDWAQAGKIVTQVLLPVVMTDLLTVFAECVRFDNSEVTVEDLPHYCIPKLAVAWIEESFIGADKLSPWMEAAVEVGRRLGISDKETSTALSSFFSQPGTQSQTSPADSKTESPT
jgi:hypothetical protein